MLTMADISSLTQIEKAAYTITEAMAATGLGRTSIFKELKEGRLKAVKAGRRTLIPAGAISAWLDSLPEA
jgi:excisionase family DNA binding protein